MKKIILGFYFFLPPIHAWAVLKDPGLARLATIREEGHGVLSEEDISDEMGSIYREGNQLGYWTCFDTKDVVIECEDMGFTSDGHMSDIKIVAIRAGERHYYGYRHAVGLSICNAGLRRWKKIRKKHKKICIEGAEAGMESTIDADGKMVTVYGWVWDRWKVVGGCLSYWGDSCEGP